MGIRYYAQAFHPDLTELALADPRGILPRDPLAVSRDIDPETSIARFSSEAPSGPDGFLYLDKEWRVLQDVTGPTAARPARKSFRLLEGDVTHGLDGWASWVRALRPDEIPAIAHDLLRLAESRVEESVRGGSPVGRDVDREVEWAMHYFRAARAYAADCAGWGLGVVYEIG